MTERLQISLDVRALAVEIVKLMEQTQTEVPRYYTANDNPLGKRRFLECAREKFFPTFSVDGRGKLLARREDVHAWIESQWKSTSASEIDEVDEVDRALGRAATAGKILLTRRAG